MLCIVLATFVTVERAVAADPCRGAPSAVFYNIADAAILSDGGIDQSDTQQSLPMQQHHCCSAHIAAMPPVHAAGVVVRAPLLVQAVFGEANPPNHEQNGPDRPPRSPTLA